MNEDCVMNEEKKEIRNPNATLIQSNYVEVREEDINLNVINIPKDSEVPTPSLNVAVPVPSEKVLIPDDEYLSLLNEIVSNIKDDRNQVSGYIDNMADLVINDGDSTTATKEALVNLVKIKTDLQDKMLKVADLMTRLKLKNTYAYSGPHLNTLQQNNFNIGSESNDFDRKELIRTINKAKKRKG